MGAILTAHTDFFHGIAERLHLRKSWHGTARGAETDIFGSARQSARLKISARVPSLTRFTYSKTLKALVLNFRTALRSVTRMYSFWD